MKFLALVVLLCGALLCAQDAPKTPAAPPAHAHGQMGMHRPMLTMEEEAAKMRATLEKMKANLSKITDPAAKEQAQLDAELWEDLVQHMESMAQMMKAHSGMGMDMKGHPPMPEDKAPTPDKK